MLELSSSQIQFIDKVLALHPRVAAFDCDGTLWSGDAGEGFFSWELEQKLVSDEIASWARPRYADYKAGKVAEDVMCGEMVTLHRGLPEALVQEAATRFFEQRFASRIFPEMRELILQLKGARCELWAVSSTNEWVIRAAMKHFDISSPRILAASVEIDNGIVTDRLIRVPSGPGKPEAIRKVTGILDSAFGNSIWDHEMLAMAKHGFAINPNPDLRKIAVDSGWTVYDPPSFSENHR